MNSAKNSKDSRQRKAKKPPFYNFCYEFVKITGAIPIMLWLRPRIYRPYGTKTPRGGVRIFHLPQPVMDMPAKTMQTRQLGGGAEVPDRMKSPDDIAPLFACIMAFTAATTPNRKENKVYESAYANGAELMFV